MNWGDLVAERFCVLTHKHSHVPQYSLSRYIKCKILVACFSLFFLFNYLAYIFTRFIHLTSWWVFEIQSYKCMQFWREPETRAWTVWCGMCENVLNACHFHVNWYIEQNKSMFRCTDKNTRNEFTELRKDVKRRRNVEKNPNPSYISTF